MPASRATSSAFASARSENTPTMRAGTRPSSTARSSACRLEPRPEATTAIRYIRRAFSGVTEPAGPPRSTPAARAPSSADAHALAAAGGDDFADAPVPEAATVEVALQRGERGGRHDQHET